MKRSEIYALLALGVSTLFGISAYAIWKHNEALRLKVELEDCRDNKAELKRYLKDAHEALRSGW